MGTGEGAPQLSVKVCPSQWTLTESTRDFLAAVAIVLLARLGS